MDNLFNSANAIYDEIVAIRRDIHAHPELGCHEERTAKLIKEKLTEYGVDTIESLTPTSVIATVKGHKDNGKCIAIRTDIDALPVTEATDLPFSSEYEGVMHACGHDIHCSMMLGNAKLLCSMRDKFEGTVKLIFQHSEDTQPGGAKELAALGVMDGVDAILGMHVSPEEDPDNYGKVCFKEGPITSSADLAIFHVKGHGGHSSEPHKLNDPILAAAQMIVLLQQINSRYVDAKETIIFPMGYINGGNKINIVPDTVEFAGAARAYSNEVRDIVEDQCKKISRGVSEMSGCDVECEYVRGYSPCYNDPELNTLVRSAVSDVLGSDHIVDFDQPMGFSEDFSAYAEVSGKPALFMMLKAGNGGSFAPLHNSTCTFNEKAIPYGMTAMVAGALSFLAQ